MTLKITIILLALITAVFVPITDARAQTENDVHIVQAGKTLGKIAAAYRVSMNELIAPNDLPNPNLIYAGSRSPLP